MVKLFNNIIINDGFQLFQIYQVARCVCNFAFNGYKQVVIMPMPVGIGAFAKYFVIFFSAPFLTVHPVSGIKMFLARYVYHHNICGCKYTKQKYVSCFILAVKKKQYLASPCPLQRRG